MKIILAPNDILSAPVHPVGKIDPQVLKLVEQMKKTMLKAEDPEGVGLAAPQVGKSLAIFIARPSPKGKILTFINPKIIEIGEPSESFTRKRKVKNKKSKNKPKQLEGCLSLKNIWGTVLRSPTLTLSFLDEKGQKQKKKFDGFLATIIQHEYDHLNGVLFPKRVLEQKGKLYKSHKDEKGEDVFDEIEI